MSLDFRSLRPYPKMAWLLLSVLVFNKMPINYLHFKSSSFSFLLLFTWVKELIREKIKEKTLLLLYQWNRFFSCNGKNISAGNSGRTSSFQRSLYVINNTKAPHRVIIWKSLFLTFYGSGVVQQKWSITTLKQS